METIRQSYLYTLWMTLCVLWKESLVGRGIAAASRFCRKTLDESAAARFVCREGAIARSWPDSLLCRTLSALLNLPAAILHGIYRLLQPLLDDSFFAGLAFEAGAETAIAQSWFIMLLWCIPFIYWNNAYNLTAYILLLLLFYVRGMKEKAARLDLASVGFYPLVMFAAVCLAVPLSSHPDLSGRFLTYHLVCALSVLITVSAVRSGDDLKRLCAGAGGAVLVSSLYGVYQRIQGVEVNASYVDLTVNEGMPGRVMSYFDNPNTFAEMLILLLPLIVALVLCSRHWITRLMAAAVCAVGVAALGMTYSRASWVGIACAAVVFVFLWKPRLIPVFAALCLLCIPLLPDTIWHRILTITNTSDTSTASRVPLYEAALGVIKTSPITGGGLGTAAVQKFIKENQLYHGDAPYTHAHNIYLEVWVEAGLLGILAFLGTMLWGLKHAVRQIRSCPDSAARTITAAAAASLCGGMVAGLADYLWQYPRVMSIYWLVFAVALAGAKLCRAEAQ